MFGIRNLTTGKIAEEGGNRTLEAHDGDRLQFFTYSWYPNVLVEVYSQGQVGQQKYAAGMMTDVAGDSMSGTFPLTSLDPSTQIIYAIAYYIAEGGREFRGQSTNLMISRVSGIPAPTPTPSPSSVHTYAVANETTAKTAVSDANSGINPSIILEVKRGDIIRSSVCGFDPNATVVFEAMIGGEWSTVIEVRSDGDGIAVTNSFPVGDVSGAILTRARSQSYSAYVTLVAAGVVVGPNWNDAIWLILMTGMISYRSSAT